MFQFCECGRERKRERLVKELLFISAITKVTNIINYKYNNALFQMQQCSSGLVIGFKIESKTAFPCLIHTEHNPQRVKYRKIICHALAGGTAQEPQAAGYIC